MFRKSVSFFILVALFWVLLWVYIPDGSPDSFSIGDVFRGAFLLFSFMTAGFALLMLFIRYNGLDMVINLIPHGALTLWLGKHAYQYSQPKVILNTVYQGGNNNLKITIDKGEKVYKQTLKQQNAEAINIGIVKQQPTVEWIDNKGTKQIHTLFIMHHIKHIGRNLKLKLLVFDDRVEVILHE